MRGKILFLATVFTALFCLARARADNITLEQFGGKADGATDDGPAFAQAFDYARAHPGTTLHLGGTCRINTPQSIDRGNPKYIRRAGAAGKGISGLTIEDGRILLGGPFGAFSFEKCPGLTLRNVTFDYDPPIMSQGKIISVDPASARMTVVPDPGYPSPASPAFTSDDWLTIHKPNGDYAYFFVAYIQSAVAGPDGHATLAYGRRDITAALAGHNDLRYAYVQRAFGNLLLFQFCDGVHLENCSIYGTSAFASLFLFCNDVVLTGNKICPEPGSGRIVSTSADGFHFIGARRGPRIENNFFDHVQDDNIVISLRGNRIRSCRGTQLQLAGQSCTWYEPGDTIEVVSPTESARREYKIVSMPPMTNLFLPPVITLDRPLEGTIVPLGGDYPTLVFNKSWRLDGTVIRHNSFQNSRRYAVFMGAGGVTIADNTVYHLTNAAFLLSFTQDLKTGGGGLNYYPSSEITVTGNRISGAFDNGEEGRDFSQLPYGAIQLFDSSRDQLHLQDFHLARYLDIENNTISDCGGTGIYVANASNVTITGNTITNPNRHKENPRYGIWLQSAPATAAQANTVQGTGFDAPVQVDP